VNTTDTQPAQEFASRVISNIQRVIVGQDASVRFAVMGLLARGHVLIEGAPGVGKTMFARSLARSIDASFKRVQCTSDLLPTDITGTYVFDQRDRDFHFRPGPIISNLVLVDEINRAPPRTQSAFLESMEEQQVTVDGVTHPIPEPFMLIATRNPFHHVGTFPLPETELDRFLVGIELDYPDAEEEVDIVTRQLAVHPIEELGSVASLDDVHMAQATLRHHIVDPEVVDYVVAVVNAVREDPSVTLKPSPRATVALVNLARANAIVEGRDYTTPDDVKAVASAVLGHRLAAGIKGHGAETPGSLVRDVLRTVPIEGSRGSSERSGS
jgi:MoxR-like ATPase